jgi:hypothetical protein
MTRLRVLGTLWIALCLFAALWYTQSKTAHTERVRAAFQQHELLAANPAPYNPYINQINRRTPSSPEAIARTDANLNRQLRWILWKVWAVTVLAMALPIGLIRRLQQPSPATG